ncbi:MAG TPA: type IV secretion system DNA-binding domain-containing protein [Candidatus Paceibacterota bacterium]|nr:type IV secretion system DNA-binding domain-containing protein [Candidatus Paceibacterota bacterium]
MDNPERITYFAATDSRGKRTPFGIKARDRERHMYVIGKTGMGKSTLLENMAIQDIRNGEGLAFIDPHGSAVDKLLDYIPEERLKDVIYFAPFDLEQPIAFNVMEDVGYDKRHLVVSGLMATFKKIWVDAWSARMEYILSNTLLALLEYPDATLLGVNRMYTDKEYRKKVVANVKDPLVKSFWEDEFANYGDRYTQEATPAIQNKIGQFTSNPLIRNIIGQPKSSFDIRECMDNRKILLINLSKGLVGDTNMKLLGSMLTTRIFLGAMSRAELDERSLKRSAKFYFYVDEFQNFANETFAEILSEARKYNLNLLIAHQYVEQMEEEVRAAVFGNVGTTVAFRVGPFDAEVLETVFAPEFTQEDLVNLGFAQVYLTLMIDGIGSRPFSAVTLPPIEPPPRSYRKEVIELSRATYGNARGPIEKALFEELSAARAASLAAHKEASTKPPRFAPKGAAARPARPAPRTPAGEPERAAAPTSAPLPPPRPARPMPPSGEKSAEDLKSILRRMTSKERAQRQGESVAKQQSLKGALADALAKAPPPSAASGPSASALPHNPPPKPFEVPEERLRSILKGDD